MVEHAKNRYVVIPPGTSNEIAWDPSNDVDLPIPDCAYIGRVLSAMEEIAPLENLTFYITANLDRLPSYGSDVVVITISDEWCRIPRYVFDVRATFKTYGTSLSMNWRALLRPSLYELTALAQDFRNALRGLPLLAAYARSYAGRLARGRWPHPHVYDLPLGYYRQESVPFVAINDRQFDVYFAGSVRNRDTPMRLVHRLTPKVISRRRMLARLERLKKRYPALRITTALTTGFMQTSESEAVRYSKAMMQTKICIVPRGTSLETYRYFEGLRFGCVVIAERLPHRWFYDGAPVRRIHSWTELDRLIPALLADPARLETLSRASLAWWSDRCSERAVGAFMARRIAAARTPADRDAARNADPQFGRENDAQAEL